MLGINMWPIYRKWIIIVVLSGCVYFVGYTDKVESVFAAPCIEECENNLNDCNDACAYTCEMSTEEDCDDCLSECSQAFFLCLIPAVSCEQLDVPPAQCSVEYGSHCPIIGGVADCSNQDAYNAYFLICDQPVGSGQCVSCPYANYECVGSNGLPSCY